ncbi:MAG: hypothetical protein OEW62_04015 [Candidatus Bathyarchaeota archaeon]|nr:hypothetical protein [Candidatus Bathyarchaeota archaeon]MDH5745490.1 hypothetical protein [Candidatus Bathyarchaeota archaeon]
MPKKKHKRVAVGFYKDDGKTKPVTKSTGEVQRKKLIQNPRRFKGVKPRRYLGSETEELAREATEERLQRVTDEYCKKHGLPLLEVSIAAWYGLKEEEKMQILHVPFVGSDERAGKAAKKQTASIVASAP